MAFTEVLVAPLQGPGAHTSTVFLARVHAGHV